jgi:3-methylcrotonyl-CoA carboxylase alpha subunit
VLEHCAILGVTTNLPLLRAIASDAEFALAHTHTDFLSARDLAATSAPSGVPLEVLVAAAIFELLDQTESSQTQMSRNPWSHRVGLAAAGQHPARYLFGTDLHHIVVATIAGQRGVFAVSVDGQAYPAGEARSIAALLRPDGELLLDTDNLTENFRLVRSANSVLVAWRGQTFALAKPQPPDVDATAHTDEMAPGDRLLVAPMAGTIIKVNVSMGEQVRAHQTLVVLGAMKMEHAIAAPYAGRVRRVAHRVGDVVPGGEPLVELEGALDGH